MESEGVTGEKVVPTSSGNDVGGRFPRFQKGPKFLAVV